MNRENQGGSMNTRDRFIVIGACLASAFAGAIGTQLVTGKEAWAQSSRSLRTERLEIVDASGRLRGLLALDRSGRPVLAFYGADGNARFGISLEERDSPMLLMNGSAGHDLIGMAVHGDDSAEIVFSDKSNKVRGVVSVGRDGSFGIMRADASEKETHRWP
jgi:hypothetical protein